MIMDLGVVDRLKCYKLVKNIFEWLKNLKNPSSIDIQNEYFKYLRNFSLKNFVLKAYLPTLMILNDITITFGA